MSTELVVNNITDITDNIKFAFSKERETNLSVILRQRIYNNKLLAVLREYISNAIDASINAKIDIPIRITIPTSFNPVFEVQDFATGIHPDKISEVFFSYGQSTKSDSTGNSLSDKMIGKYGLGSKAGFAYCNTFVIENSYEGVTYCYLLHIDQASNPIATLIDTRPASRAGLKVIVPIEESDFASAESILTKFRLCSEYPLVFNNIVKDLSIQYQDSIFTVTEHDRNTRTGTYFVINNIPYPTIGLCIANDLPRYYDNVRALLNGIPYTNVYIKLPSDFVSLSPSRESFEIPNPKDFFDKFIAYIATHCKQLVDNFDVRTDCSLPEYIRQFADYPLIYLANKLSFFHMPQIQTVMEGFSKKYNMNLRLPISYNLQTENFPFILSVVKKHKHIPVNQVFENTSVSTVYVSDRHDGMKYVPARASLGWYINVNSANRKTLDYKALIQNFINKNYLTNVECIFASDIYQHQQRNQITEAQLPVLESIPVQLQRVLLQVPSYQYRSYANTQLELQYRSLSVEEVTQLLEEPIYYCFRHHIPTTYMHGVLIEMSEITLHVIPYANRQLIPAHWKRLDFATGEYTNSIVTQFYDNPVINTRIKTKMFQCACYYFLHRFSVLPELLEHCKMNLEAYTSLFMHISDNLPHYRHVPYVIRHLAQLPQNETDDFSAIVASVRGKLLEMLQKYSLFPQNLFANLDYPTYNIENLKAYIAYEKARHENL